MGKTAFIFPGQGSQYVGMCKDFYEDFDSSREIIDMASEVSGFDMKKLLFEENELLDQTKYTQAAMVAVELAILKAVEEKGIKADYTAGLSLGEYSALSACGAMKPEDAIKLVTVRGRIMQEAVPEGGAMLAVLSCPTELIEKICKETEGDVSIANYNCPGQIVITGEEEAVAKAGEALKAAGAKRCIPLNVSGPFHSAMFKEASEELAVELSRTEFNDPLIPYVCNVNAVGVDKVEEIRPLLKEQIYSSVKWQQSIEWLINEGVDRFIEIGPKKSLTGFMKKIAPEVTAINIDKVEDLQKL